MQTANSNNAKIGTNSQKVELEILQNILAWVSEETKKVEEEIRCLRPSVQGIKDKASIKECLEKIHGEHK